MRDADTLSVSPGLRGFGRATAGGDACASPVPTAGALTDAREVVVRDQQQRLPGALTPLPEVRALWLGQCGARLPDAVASLPKLEAIHVDGGALIGLPTGLRCPPLRVVAVWDSALRALPAGLTGLRVLSVAGNRPLRSLPPEVAGPQLEFLDLRHTGLATLPSLARAPRLRTLRLDHCAGLDLEEVGSAPGLTTLTLDDGRATGVLRSRTLRLLHASFLERAREDGTHGADAPATPHGGPVAFDHLPALRHADLRGWPGRDVDDLLTAAPRLRWLDLSASGRVHTLADHPQLVVLRANRCGSLRRVCDLPALRRLTVHGARLDLTLRGLPALHSLDLSFSSGVAPALWRGLPALRELRLRACGLQTLGALPPTLRVLDIRDNRGLRWGAAGARPPPELVSLDARGVSPELPLGGQADGADAVGALWRALSAHRGLSGPPPANEPR